MTALSKRLMAGECPVEALNLVSEDGMKALNLHYLDGTSATGLDTDASSLQLSNGSTLQYDRLLIATGADARVIPNLSQAANCYSLRNLNDALAIREHLTAGKRALVVGAGFIGTELAAIAKTSGCEVTVIDKSKVPLGARVGDIVGKRIEKLHEANGVVFHNDCELREVKWRDRTITEVRLDTGVVIACDVIVVAIGAVPSVQWCSGLNIRSGVVCNEYCEAAPNVYAAGDAAEWFHKGYGEHMRIEHRTNASEQAMAAAKNMLGSRVEYAPLPFFWSDQYQVQIHSYGRIGPQYTVEVVEGDQLKTTPASFATTRETF
jgi:NADPH-dependent 2,4-dienoyl-CoA reductase/sulfur reductase-like enzyme